jgi:tetratricopeptide (TPR) repeat protein
LDVRARIWRLAMSVVAVALITPTTALPQISGAEPDPPSDLVSLRIIVLGTAVEAEQIIKRVQAGESFPDLAKALSIDPTADAGGLLDAMPRSALRPELREALQGLEPGHVSGIVRVPTGFAVLQLAKDADRDRPARRAGSDGGLNPAVSAEGSVRYLLEVGGQNESLMALDLYQKPPDWEQDPRTVCAMRRQSLESLESILEDSLSPTPARNRALPPEQVWHAHFSLGQVYAYQGRMRDAIAHFQRAYALARTESPATAPQLEQALGVAYLHAAEMANGIYEKPGDRCLLSTKGLIAALTKTDDARHAIEYFGKVLARKPDELEARWLLNIAYMMTGGYPERVPAAYRIPPSAFSSAEDVGRFVDVAPQLGVQAVRQSGGMIVDDFDSDGRWDIVASTIESCTPVQFFHGNADGTFTERTAAAGLGAELGGLNVIQADYDNDGCLDILLMRGGWEFRQRQSLLRNNCDGTFTNVTVASGLARPSTRSQTAVWTDINNDGFVDLFVGAEDTRAQLFLNRKNGTFEDIAHAAGVDRSAYTKSVTAGDYDNDGWPDLYVSNFGGANYLYHNNRDGTFTEVAWAAGVPGPRQGFGAWFFDYDNDGWLDLFVTSYYASIDDTARTYLGMPNNAPTLKLYRNRGQGRFHDATAAAGLEKVFMPMGANFGDIDNDGFLDIYLGTGNPSYTSLMPSVLLRNRNGTRFVDVTTSSGTGDLHKGHGVAFADLDRDGNDEIFFQVGGAVPGDAHALRIFHNPGHANDWINLKLVGVETNRAALGARIKITVENRGVRREIHRTVGSGASFGASPLEQHIGLGAAARIVDVEVWWPTSDTRQHFGAVEKNQTLEIRESGRSVTRLERPRLDLPAARGTMETTHVP